MNVNRCRRLYSSGVYLASILCAAGIMPADSAVAQQQTSRDAENARQGTERAKAKTTIYRLKYADVVMVTEVLKTVFADEWFRVAPDERSHSVIVLAGPALDDKISVLIESLDQPAARPAVAENSAEVRVLRLNHADVEMVARVIATVFRDGELRVAVENPSNSMIVYAVPAVLDKITALIADLDRQPARPATTGLPIEVRTLQVRIVWLMSGELVDEAAPAVPPGFDEVAEELSTIGVSGLRTVAQVIAKAQVGHPIELTCSPLLKKDCQLNVVGQVDLESEAQRPALDINLSAVESVFDAEGRQMFGRGRSPTREFVSLKTRIDAPFHHYVVLGVSPVEKSTSVFVLQVTPVD
jgi:hypothetical protein